MKAQANFLIKLKDFNIIVSDEKPKLNDVVYINNEIYSNEIRIFTSAFGYDNLKDCVKVLALDSYTKYPHNLPSIDYNGLEEDFGVVDVEKQLSESEQQPEVFDIEIELESILHGRYFQPKITNNQIKINTKI
jgi:hypothetical protein